MEEGLVVFEQFVLHVPLVGLNTFSLLQTLRYVQEEVTLPNEVQYVGFFFERRHPGDGGRQLVFFSLIAAFSGVSHNDTVFSDDAADKTVRFVVVAVGDGTSQEFFILELEFLLKVIV